MLINQYLTGPNFQSGMRHSYYVKWEFTHDLPKHIIYLEAVTASADTLGLDIRNARDKGQGLTQAE